MLKPNNLTTATTKNTKRNGRGMATAGIVVSVMILIAAGVAVLVYNATTSGNAPRGPRRITLYTNYDSSAGGACGNYEYEIIGKTQSNRLETCVDNVEKASDLIPNRGAYSSNRINGIRLIKIDADVHTETQRLSPSTPEPQYGNYEVVVIDNVYSAELFVSNTTK